MEVNKMANTALTRAFNDVFVRTILKSIHSLHDKSEIKLSDFRRITNKIQSNKHLTPDNMKEFHRAFESAAMSSKATSEVRDTFKYSKLSKKEKDLYKKKQDAYKRQKNSKNNSKKKSNHWSGSDDYEKTFNSWTKNTENFKKDFEKKYAKKPYERTRKKDITAFSGMMLGAGGIGYVLGSSGKGDK